MNLAIILQAKPVVVDSLTKAKIAANSEKFSQIDPWGVGLTVIGMFVVFMSLLVLYLMFMNITRFLNYRIKHRKKEKVEKEKEIIKEIEEKRPDILLVGMGVPKQEKWITKNLSRLNVPVCMGVGGSFDVLSGKIPRAPLWMQKHGMEWIYRLIREPKRVLRIIALFYFIWLVILGKMIFTLTEKEID